jgi:rod shape-determining protein MreC
VARAVTSGTRTDVVLLIVSGAMALAAIAMPGNLRDPVAAFFRRTLIAPLVVIQGKAELARQALVRHDAETAAQDSVVLRAQLVPGLEAENERLRRMLGLGHALKWGFVPAEALRGRTPGEEFTMTLTAGSREGVRPFSAVIAPEGLVGMVESSDPTTSQAISWAHPDFRVSAMTGDGVAFGIVKAYQGAGGDRYLLELSGVQLSTTLAPGTPIVSSGVGGVYPRGIPVGTITRELSTSEGWARTYLLRPAVKPQDITSVLIVEPRRAAAGIQSVYAATADSAVRADSAAADSADAPAEGAADSIATVPKRGAGPR